MTPKNTPDDKNPASAHANVAASVRARLLNLAKARQENFDFVLNRYASERLLYRLGQSPHAARFVLKGATLFALWSKTPHRPTRDLDLLGAGDASIEAVVRAFADIIAIEVQDDGLAFDGTSLSGHSIKEEEEYEGVRVRLTARLGGARIPLQIDVGFGDAVTPAPEDIEYPTLLGHSAPRLRAYPRETVIAEKFEAMVKLAHDNSRMKDFYDVWVLLRARDYDQGTLRRALAATFARRGMHLPGDVPLALRDEFGADEGKVVQWSAFCRRNALADAPLFADVIADLRVALHPLLAAA